LRRRTELFPGPKSEKDRKQKCAGVDGEVRDPDGWLCPLCVDGNEEAKADRNGGRQASNRRYFPVALPHYLRILE
jgi:hypothetical protein